jgi:hypothetical protein
VCEVSEEKKSCIHCRYMKCLEIGMTPDKMQVDLIKLSYFFINIIYHLRAKGKKMPAIMTKKMEMNQLLVKMKSKKIFS